MGQRGQVEQHRPRAHPCVQVRACDGIVTTQSAVRTTQRCDIMGRWAQLPFPSNGLVSVEAGRLPVGASVVWCGLRTPKGYRNILAGTLRPSIPA